MPSDIYEKFVRKAFGLKINGMHIGLNSDPALLANQETFNDTQIDKVKIAVGYSMEIFYNEILGNAKILDGIEDSRIENFLSRVVNAKNLIEISDLIDEYQTSVLDEYFNLDNGVLTIKNREV